MSESNKDKTKLGNIDVGKRTLRIEDLEDKVHFAIESYNRAFEKYKRGDDSIQDWNIVIKALSLQLEELRDYIAVAYHNIGVIYATKGNFEKGIENFTKALQFNPQYPVAHHNLALVYKKAGDMELAQKHFDAAKKLGFNKDSS